jgi:hypothetical protein
LTARETVASLKGNHIDRLTSLEAVMTHVDLPDVLVHIDETLGHDQLKDLEVVIRSDPGVIAVGFRDDKPHLMVVQYDPEQTQATHILHLITSRGIHAELVGM